MAFVPEFSGLPHSLKKLWMFIEFRLLYYNEFKNDKYCHAWVVYWKCLSNCSHTERFHHSILSPWYSIRDLNCHSTLHAVIYCVKLMHAVMYCLKQRVLNILKWTCMNRSIVADVKWLILLLMINPLVPHFSPRFSHFGVSHDNDRVTVHCAPTTCYISKVMTEKLVAFITVDCLLCRCPYYLNIYFLFHYAKTHF